MSESSQSLLSVLNNFVEENNTSQRLIASQTRGGLIAVKNEEHWVKGTLGELKALKCL